VIHTGGANKPYSIGGRLYTPVLVDASMSEDGMASWYGRKFHGRSTSSGEPYDMFAMTAAHPTMPIPSYARVRNPANGREIVVRVNDRGPFTADRVMDLSWAAASKLGIANRVSEVEVRRITNVEIQAGMVSGGSVIAGGGGGDESTPARTTTVVTVPATGARPPVAPARPVVEPEPAVAAPVAAPVPGFWLQLGAFSRESGAQTLKQEVSGVLDWIAPVLNVFSEGALHRVQAGPYRTRDEAAQVAGRVRTGSQWSPIVIERR
jgi:rare lipoprotein A